MYEFRKLDGTLTIIGVWNGIIHTYNPTTDAWTAVVTAANFATASITRATSGRWFAATFNNTVVFSDSTNLPFTWDGTSGAGGLVSLTNAAVAYGRPFVHAGKLGFIQNADRSTFIWSEELAANTGYEAGGYNNAWTLKQNGSNPLVGIQGSNAGLFYFRTQGIGIITGDVTPDFATTATDDAIAESVGLGGPDAFLLHEKRFWFLDEAGRPWSLELGGGLTPLWADLEATQVAEANPGAPVVVYSFPRSTATAQVSWNPVYDLIMMRASATSGFAPYWFGFSPYTGRLVTAWQFDSGEEFYSSVSTTFTSVPAWVVGLNGSFAAAVVAGQWEDLDVSAVDYRSYSCQYRSGPQAWTTGLALHFSRLDLVAQSVATSFVTAGSAYSLRVLTSDNPVTTQSAQTVNYLTPAALNLQRYAQHEAIGLNVGGRWAAVDIQFTPEELTGVAFAPHAIYGWALHHYPIGNEPEVR
jgi:hypothetical protein